MKSRHKAGTSNHCIEKGLGSATLTVAVLVIFFILILTTLFLLVLAALLALSRLSGLTTLLTLTGLSALLALSELIAFLLHIVCHKNILLKKRETAALLRFKRHLQT
jgi:hypothetical protein